MTAPFRTSGTSGMSAKERYEEAMRIVPMLMEIEVFDQMKAHEKKFVQEMDDEFDTCSDRQLFWLRDLKQKYVE